MNDEKAIMSKRAMHGFSIPANTYLSCRCGQIWGGPAYACRDDEGYFWHCPGCEDRFADPGEGDEAGAVQ